MANQHHIHGTTGADDLTVHPGDTVHSGPGDDTITISPVIGTGNVTGHDLATVFAGPGNDTIIDQSVKESTFPVDAHGGPGNDTFVALTGGDPSQTSHFTGGAGHDLFEFSTEPFHGADNFVITDFGRHDAIQIDVNPSDLPAITFTDTGHHSTDLSAVANGATVNVELAGHFDTSQFHVTNDGQGHDIITYGHSDFLLS